MSTTGTRSTRNMTPAQARREFTQATKSMPPAEAKRIVQGAVKAAARSTKQRASAARFMEAWDKGSGIER